MITPQLKGGAITLTCSGLTIAEATFVDKMLYEVAEREMEVNVVVVTDRSGNVHRQGTLLFDHDRGEYFFSSGPWTLRFMPGNVVELAVDLVDYIAQIGIHFGEVE